MLVNVGPECPDVFDPCNGSISVVFVARVQIPNVAVVVGFIFRHIDSARLFPAQQVPIMHCHCVLRLLSAWPFKCNCNIAVQLFMNMISAGGYCLELWGRSCDKAISWAGGDLHAKNHIINPQLVNQEPLIPPLFISWLTMVYQLMYMCSACLLVIIFSEPCRNRCFYYQPYWTID